MILVLLGYYQVVVGCIFQYTFVLIIVMDAMQGARWCV